MPPVLSKLRIQMDEPMCICIAVAPVAATLRFAYTGRSRALRPAQGKESSVLRGKGGMRPRSANHGRAGRPEVE
jgi:hypothetical protein